MRYGGKSQCAGGAFYAGANTPDQVILSLPLGGAGTLGLLFLTFAVTGRLDSQGQQAARATVGLAIMCTCRRWPDSVLAGTGLITASGSGPGLFPVALSVFLRTFFAMTTPPLNYTSFLSPWPSPSGSRGGGFAGQRRHKQKGETITCPIFNFLAALRNFLFPRFVPIKLYYRVFFFFLRFSWVGAGVRCQQEALRRGLSMRPVAAFWPVLLLPKPVPFSTGRSGDSATANHSSAHPVHRRIGRWIRKPFLGAARRDHRFPLS